MGEDTRAGGKIRETGKTGGAQSNEHNRITLHQEE